MKFADQTGSSDLLNVLISSFGKVIMWAQSLDSNGFPHNALAAGHSVNGILKLTPFTLQMAK